MSTGDRSVFPRRGPEQIRNRQFVWVRKGYDPEQVQDFLSQLADHVDALETEMRSAREEMDKASRRQSSAREEAYQELAKRMADMLSMADAQAETVRKEAEQNANQTRAEADAAAERTRKEAEADAERVRKEAKDEAERLIREAAVGAEQLKRENEEALRKMRTEAEHIVGVLSSRRDMLLQEVQVTKERLTGVLERVNAAVPPPPSAAQAAPAQTAAHQGQPAQPAAPPSQPPQSALPEQPPAPEEASTEASDEASDTKEKAPPQPRKASSKRSGQREPRPGSSNESGAPSGDENESLELMLPEIPVLEEELEG